MVHVEFIEEPEYFGYSGCHLYGVKPEMENNEKRLYVSKDSYALNLYKLSGDILTFLSNEIDPYPEEGNLKIYPVFGNPKHRNSFANHEDEGYQLIGILDQNDVQDVCNFLNSNNLGEKDGVKEYHAALDEDVKEHLIMLLDNRVIDELHLYLKEMVRFFNNCKESKNEVVIIYNG